MCNENFVNTILLDWAAKSPNGLLSDVSNEENIQSLYESMMENGINEEDSMAVVNDVSMLAEKGKHPERQAYNKNGLLVTFPTPEYKARAIARGTHSEVNPKVAQNNLFGGGKTAPTTATPTTPTTPDAAGTSPMDTKQSELPPSATSQAQTPPAQKEVPEPGTPGTPAASAPSPSPMSASPSQPPAQGELPTSPVPTTTAAANVAAQTPTPTPTVQKTPAELAAEKEVIKQILNTNDTMPTIPGVGGVGISEELKKLTKIALEMNLNEAVKFLSKYL